jgi:hypothetical protein
MVTASLPGMLSPGRRARDLDAVPVRRSTWLWWVAG